jgi:hypothetical protein
MAGMLHLAFTRWRITNLKQRTQQSHLARTTLSFGEGAFPSTMGHAGAAPSWLTFHVAFFPQSTLLNQRELNSVVVCP